MYLLRKKHIREHEPPERKVFKKAYSAAYLELTVFSEWIPEPAALSIPMPINIIIVPIICIVLLIV